MGRKGLNQAKKYATLAIDIIFWVPFTDRVRCPFSYARCPQLGFGTQLKFDKISPTLPPPQPVERGGVLTHIPNYLPLPLYEGRHDTKNDTNDVQGGAKPKKIVFLQVRTLLEQ